MNFQEYCARTVIEKVYRVDVNRKDLFTSYHHPLGEEVALVIPGKNGEDGYFTYVVKKDTGIFWTKDSDGNPVHPSVFHGDDSFLSFDKYRERADNLLKRKYGISLHDAGVDDDTVKEFHEAHDLAVDLVLWLGEKHELTLL